MAVTSHVYPKALVSMLEAGINLTSDTLEMGLCTASAATWGSTQQAYEYVSDVTGAYTEVTSTGYARVTLTDVTVTASGADVTVTCSSPISFGSDITLSAASGFIYDSSVGSADSSYPVIAIIDFDGTISSTSSTWTYTVDSSLGLFQTSS